MINLILPSTEDGVFTKLDNIRDAIFLAGPCPRENYDNDDWRIKEALPYLESIGFNGTIISPTNKYFAKLEGTDVIKKQIDWEREAMYKASVIVFWIDRSEGRPAFTTNYEVAEWWRKDSIVIGMPQRAIKNDYPKQRLAQINKQYFETLQETLDAAVKILNRESEIFFISDTHFSQQRTLELSRRPFFDVLDMDLHMISNWNKKITSNDSVIHAGDFGDLDKMAEIINCLNFKELHLVIGNYERNELDKLQQVLAGIDRKIYTYKYMFFNDKKTNTQYFITHEPVTEYYQEAVSQFGNGNFVTLFGHIHGRAFAKVNGFDLGIDYHNYEPLSIEQVRWFTNAMQYWDENVFTFEAKYPEKLDNIKYKSITKK